MVRADYVPVKVVFLALLALQPPFGHSVSRVTAAQLPYSWHRGCPVAPAQLRRGGVFYLGFAPRGAPRAPPVTLCPLWGRGSGFPRLSPPPLPLPRGRPRSARHARWR